VRQHARSGNGLHDYAAGARRSAHVDSARAHRGLGTYRAGSRRIALACAALSVMLLAACATLGHTTFGASTAADAWPTTLATARGRATTGDFEGADSALAQFARQYPHTASAVESAYWRALFKMDPANHSASLNAAMASLDAYIADTTMREHVVEAISLRRVAGELESLNKLAMTALAQAKEAKASAASATAAAADARDAAAKDALAKSNDVMVSASSADEIKRLKDDLAKANAELERIRKRLSQPTKP
jgi:hypothetical protein